jgi:ribonuclease HI
LKLFVYTDAAFILKRSEGIVLYITYYKSEDDKKSGYKYIVSKDITDNNIAEELALMWAFNNINTDKLDNFDQIIYYSDSLYAISKLKPFETTLIKFEHISRIYNKVNKYTTFICQDLRNKFKHDKQGMLEKFVGHVGSFNKIK